MYRGELYCSRPLKFHVKTDAAGPYIARSNMLLFGGLSLHGTCKSQAILILQFNMPALKIEEQYHNANSFKERVKMISFSIFSKLNNRVKQGLRMKLKTILK